MSQEQDLILTYHSVRFIFTDPSDLICILGQLSANQVDLRLTAKNIQIKIGLVYVVLILGLVSTIPMVCKIGFANRYTPSLFYSDFLGIENPMLVTS